MRLFYFIAFIFCASNLHASTYINDTNRNIKLAHPNADKGLTRITSDRVHIYGHQKSKESYGSSIKFGQLQLNELKNGNGREFVEIYDRDDNPILMFNYAKPLTKKFGRISWDNEIGLMFASGRGIFTDTATPQPSEIDKLKLFAFPMTTGLLWTIQFSDHQIILPYVRGGVGFTGYFEIDDDFKSPKFAASLLGQGSVGIGFSLSGISKNQAARLDDEYGINGMWFTLEYKNYAAISGDYQFTSDFINAGLMMNF